MSSGDYAGALASFLGAAQLDRAAASLYRNIGLAQGKLGQLDAEIASYQQALAVEDQDWRTRALLSDRLRARGDPGATSPLVLTRPEFRAEQQSSAWDNLSPTLPSSIDVGGADIGYLNGFDAAEKETLPSGSTSPTVGRTATAMCGSRFRKRPTV